jgi:hypothetical protein
MAKLTLTDVASGYQTVAADNANNALIEAALENTLSRDGTGPNTMSANIDMNGYALLNGTAASPADLNFSYGGNWATSTAYLVNALVSVLTSDDVHNGGAAYICVTAHTSGTFATDLSATKWRLFAARGVSGASSPTGTVTGTNAIVGTSAVIPLLSYDLGTTWTFVAAATNTGAVTVNIDGLGIKSITKNGTTALVAGDILIGAEVTLFYDGTQYQDTALRQPDKLVFPGSTSGTATLKAAAAAGTPTLTLPTTTDTLVGKATVDTLTNKTLVAPALGTPVSGNLTNCTGVQYDGFKNKIIGGDFTVNPWQRGTSFAAIAGAYFADRWLAAHSSTAVVTASKAADAPTATQAGIFTQHCISLAVTTVDTAIAAGDYWLVQQAIEGLNAASFGFGQSGSRNVNLSFWVKGTKTGIHCVSIRNGAGNRSYVAEYTIVTTNTWEYKTITIPVDTAVTWLYDTGIGLNLTFALMSGTTWHTTANTWAAGQFFTTANQVNALDSTSNTFKIALVQLEAGSVATSFDVRSVGTELALCQRYFEVTGQLYGTPATGAYYGYITWSFSVAKRAAPTITYSATSNVTTGSIGITSVNAYRAAPTNPLIHTDSTASAEL